MSDFDSVHLSDGSQTSTTRDFVALCISLVTVALVILVIILCKWSHRLCFNSSSTNRSENGTTTTVSTLSSRGSGSRPHHNRRRPSATCQNRSTDPNHNGINVRDGFLSPPAPLHYPPYPQETKSARLIVTVVPSQSSQQVVPRLSISPHGSSSSLTRNSYNFKQ